MASILSHWKLYDIWIQKIFRIFDEFRFCWKHTKCIYWRQKRVLLPIWNIVSNEFEKSITYMVNLSDLFGIILVILRKGFFKVEWYHSSTIMCSITDREISRNENADELAKSGFNTLYIRPEPVLDIPTCLIKSVIKNWIANEQKNYWNETLN